MKRKFTLLCALGVACLFALPATAQYAKGDITFNAGLSFGLIGYNWGYSGGSGFPPLSVNAEYSINDKFAVGPYLGYYSRSYDYSYFGSRYDWNFRAIAFGGRGTLHASGLLNDLLDININEEKVDLYGTVLLGFETYSWDYGDYNGVVDNETGSFVLGSVVGIRYMFNPKFGAFFEGGRGAFGYGTIGISAKF